MESTEEPVGFLKYGHKNLYFYRKDGKVVEKQNVPCLLDFYVLDTLQRQGVGLKLFEAMRTEYSLYPWQLAYDRPSPKLTLFLRKHYDLKQPDLQPNRYAIYPSEGYQL